MPLFKQKRQVDIRMRKSGGYSLEFLGGCAARFSKSWPYFWQKNAIPDPFSDQTLKSIPAFRPGARFSKAPGYFSGPKSNILNEI